VFPLTSSCPHKCVFCSHNGNGDDILVYKKTFDYSECISKAQKIFNSEVIIGESATRINEGEPFIYKGIEDIINILSNNKNKIIITTSGAYLNEKTIEFLSFLPNIEMNISLNSSNPEIRNFIMNDNKSSNAINAVISLGKKNIKYNGSIVALEFKDDFIDLKKTIEFLHENNAQFIRVFVPGYSNKNKKDILCVNTNKLTYSLDSIREKIPVLIEPANLNSKIIIQGILLNSPALKADLKFKDEILSVNGIEPVSSQHSFEIIKKFKNPEITIRRNKEILNKIILKNENECSGLLLYMDLSYKKFYEIKDALCDVNSCLCVSELSADFFIKKFGFDKVHVVKNMSFGGNISCNGLLTVTDIINSLNNVSFTRLILHSNFLDNDDKDILGKSVYDIVTEKYVNISLM